MCRMDFGFISAWNARAFRTFYSFSGSRTFCEFRALNWESNQASPSPAWLPLLESNAQSRRRLIGAEDCGQEGLKPGLSLANCRSSRVSPNHVGIPGHLGLKTHQLCCIESSSLVHFWPFSPIFQLFAASLELILGLTRANPTVALRV